MAVSVMSSVNGMSNGVSGLLSRLFTRKPSVDLSRLDHVQLPPVSATLSTDKSEITKNDEGKLLEPFSYYREVLSGKGLRKALLQAFNYHLNLPQTWVDGIVAIIEDLHNSSLLIDDIEDESPLRRGSPTAHIKFGVAPTINSANYVYFLVMEKITTLARAHASGTDFDTATARMVSAYVEEMLELHRGQGMEIWWRTNRVCPTVDEYLVMIERKTAGLLRLGVRLLQCHPDAKTDLPLASISEQIGVFYQLRDDYINLASTSYSTQKGFAEDISEGKYSFPMIHSLMVAPDSGLKEILDKRPEDIPEKQRAIEIMRRTHSFEASVQCLQEVADRLKAQIKALGGSPGLEAFMNQLGVDKIDAGP
ncbi:terpenoid synthase [Punctularia strigosozonata HHB-11173 SS5]|uniref:terpenoid synthase n=1 Tax=Punctularia strigosozonata (strain HHB-11173) TaxID=741275 RepID=UPI000441771D|nr:terpenoid synthase [Punctularia strigosozonata HHB-11173 SS5]EIN09901.1 terpenoid synthase [Punctularia strigosozonata HHB-11173 SS5]